MKSTRTNRDKTVRSQTGKPSDHQPQETVISEVFSDFVRRYVNKLDFRSFSDTAKHYARLGVQTLSIRTSVQQALIARQDHTHWVKPTSQTITQRNHVFCLGAIDIDQEFPQPELKHLRIEQGKLAYIWIPTATALNALESIETTLWFRTVTGLNSTSRFSDKLHQINWAPVPLCGSDTKVSLVEGSILQVPSFSERTATLISYGAQGWSIDDLTLNQRSCVEPHLASKFPNPDAHLEAYSGAYFKAIGVLASEGCVDAATKACADQLQETVLKYRHAPTEATRMAKRMVTAIMAKDPKIVGAYQRKRDEWTMTHPSDWQTRQKLQGLTPAERLAMASAILDKQA